jgi:hypothetical protein
MKRTILLIFLSVSTQIFAQKFEIRGVLPWHNFLSGPTAWNEDDYREYLDDCQKNGINFIGFHNYTGGGERYFNYVEPMVRIQYKNVLPDARFDDGSTARWGYLPMKVKDFAFGTGSLFKLPKGAEYFGADCAVLAKTGEERYEKAQALMQKVLKMAHERNMQMAMGFEFGVAPPEYASVRTRGDMYWMGDGSLVYNPFDPDAAGILYATIDNILETYKGLDYIWLWLNEHCMFGVDPQAALKNRSMNEFYRENGKYYQSSDEENSSIRFLGVWAQAYIQKAYDYIREKAPRTKVVIGGWGAEYQMGLLLKGLDKTLPEDIVFSMLNPGQGAKAHPDYFKEIAANRKIWAIPWLEGDASLWHLQPRVANMKTHVKKAAEDGLHGVVAIHWRTEGIKPNFETFSRFAVNPADNRSVDEIYRDFCLREYGTYAADHLTPLLVSTDTTGLLNGIASAVYFAYTPAWGRLNPKQTELCKSFIKEIGNCLSNENDKHKRLNLNWLKAVYEFTLLLDDVSRCIEPAWELRESYLTGNRAKGITKQQIGQAQESLAKAPVEAMIRTFASRVRSRGELGELASINQRVWGEYQLLRDFLSRLNTNH